MKNKVENQSIRNLDGGQHFNQKDYVQYKIYLKYVEVKDNGKSVGVAVPSLDISKKNIREVIDADKECGDVKLIIKRFSQTGDVSLLHSREPLPFADYTKPLQDANKIYESLPADIKSKGKNIESLLNSLTKEELEKIILARVNKDKKIEVDEKKEVKENE